MSVVRFGTVREYDAGSHTASVQIVGYPGSLVPGVPVASNIDSALLVDGARCVVVFNDSLNATDACVVAVY